MATKKATQKAWRRLPDFVGHPQIEAEPLQNQSGGLLGRSKAIWDRPLMLQGRLITRGSGMLVGRFKALPGRIRDIPRTVRKAAGAPG